MADEFINKNQGQTEEDKTLEEKAKSLKIAFLKEAPKNIGSDVINLIPEEVAQRYKIVAFDKDKNVLKVASVNPRDMDALNALRFISEGKGLEVEEYLVSEKVFNDIFSLYGGTNEIVQEAFSSFKKSESEYISDDDEEKRKKEQILKDAPVAKLVDVVISHAIEGKASDIHIEPMSHEYRVRFRVDGVLHISLILPREIGPVVVSRIKILSNLKIEEKRKPQDGRFRITEKGKEIDFRVSTLPVIEGEKVVMRILDKEGGVAQIESLGLMGLALDNLKLAMQETYGMILLTGPTGSGKSTTSYAMLKILNKEEKNIITLEDPIEYNIEGLNQSQMRPEIGYTFANGLRSVLRQDPNIILVGEIRDKETAELAVHAALTGHLLFSTLHTNTAVGAIPRLVDMGIEPFLLTSSLRLVASQRLVRRICDKCKKEIKVPEKVIETIKKELSNVSEEEFKKYKIDLSKGPKFYHGEGCKECNKTGLKGRIAIYEVVPLNEEIKDIIIEKDANEMLIEKEREKMGILTIKQDGLMKVLLGLTTIEEIERVTEGSIGLSEEGT